jgi:glycosyltransferase involved in cell wall biosynthesis
MKEPKSNPILSIIIPTKNRSHYVFSCVKNLLNIKSNEIEIIVQDNSDDNLTSDLIKSLKYDFRLIYNHIRGDLKMVNNFSIGFELSKGEYVTFIGDDDAVTSELIDAVLWAKNKNLEALVSSSIPKYYWPDIKHKLYGNSFSSSTMIKSFTNEIIYPDPIEELNNCASISGMNLCKLPKAYHGVVKRNLFSIIKKKTGTYFPGPTPDMSSAVALATIIKKYIYLDYPLYISGTGKTSGGGAGTEKKHDWKLNKIPWLSKKTIDLWSDLMPYYASGTTLWAEGFIQAITSMNFKIKNKFNYSYLYGRCLANDKNYKQEVFIVLKKYPMNSFIKYLSIFYYFIHHYREKFAAVFNNLITLSKKTVKDKSNLSSIFLKIDNSSKNIEEATQSLDVFLKKNNCSIKKVLNN